MHAVNIPVHIVERVVRRRGRAHIHDDLDPASTALVVVDMQNGFLLDEYAAYPCPHALTIMPNINRLAQTVRETGGLVVWVRNTVNDAEQKNWSQWYELSAGDPARAAKRTAAFQKDAPGHQLHQDLVVHPDDKTVLKYRYSAFIQGSSNLHELLQARGIRTVAITGTTTNACCESSARDAMMLNYKTIMVSDGTAAGTDDEHNATLTAFYAIFGDVMDTDLLIRCLRDNAKQSHAAAAV
jgi:ureidoacrylate peracid hydrolase